MGIELSQIIGSKIIDIREIFTTSAEYLPNSDCFIFLENGICFQIQEYFRDLGDELEIDHVSREDCISNSCVSPSASEAIGETILDLVYSEYRPYLGLVLTNHYLYMDGDLVDGLRAMSDRSRKH